MKKFIKKDKYEFISIKCNEDLLMPPSNTQKIFIKPK